jgi:CRP/FNR family transcriptional regulator
MKSSKNSCDLSSCFFCRGCLKEWHPAIAANKTTFRIKKGEDIFREGDSVTGIYFLERGLVKVHRKWGDTKELIMRFAKDGDIIGHRGLGSENVFPVTATALENGTVCFIPMSFFHTTLKVNHDFTYELMLFYARELQQSEKKMRNMAHMPVKGRLASALIQLEAKFGTGENGFINLQLTRQDIASYAGTTYETVFRILQEFSLNNWIETNGKTYRLIDINQLNQLADMPG